VLGQQQAEPLVLQETSLADLERALARLH
jgi:hypothetical protein